MTAQSNRLPPFAALRAFDAVGHTGGIRKAAEQLSISHAIVSRHVSGLEEWLGRSLLNRKTGQLTEAGKTYHARIDAALRELEAATEAIASEQRNSLVICCSAGFSLHWLARRLPDFHGRVRGASGPPVIDLRSADSEPSLEHGDADGDIRYFLDSETVPTGKGVRAEVLARPAVYPVASPAFLGRLARPVASAADLAGLPLIEERSAAEWAAWFAGHDHPVSAVPSPVARYGQAHLSLAAARAGQGVALSNDYIAGEDLAAGTLIRIEAPSDAIRGVVLGGYYLRSSRARYSDPLLVQFRSWIKRNLNT